MTIEIIIDIYSGRENPRWDLSNKQITQLKAKLHQLSQITAPKSSPGLGYRGFILTNKNKDPDIPDLIRAYDSCLTIKKAGQTDYYKDIHGLEKWLITEAKNMGYFPH